MSLKRYIPDTITSLNLLCGTLGVIAASKGHFDNAFILMLAAAVCDFLDGFSARLLDAYSDMGKELDSLADIVSFGVLPAVMLYNLMRTCTFSESIWCHVPLVIAVFSGLRLAKFNIDERQHHTFLGLATPACAMLCGSLCYFVAHDQDNFLAAWCAAQVFIPVLCVVLSALLVCGIPMFSMKISKDDDSVTKHKRIAFMVNVALIILIVLFLGLNWSLTVLLSFTVYILMNVVFAVFKL